VPVYAALSTSGLPACAPARGHLVDRGVQQGDTLCPFLFAAGIQAALAALPPGGAWMMGFSWALSPEVEGVLTVLQHTLPPLGLELKLQKTTVWGPGLVPAAFPLAVAIRLPLEGGEEVLGSHTPQPSTHCRWRPTWVP